MYNAPIRALSLATDKTRLKVSVADRSSTQVWEDSDGAYTGVAVRNDRRGNSHPYSLVEDEKQEQFLQSGPQRIYLVLAGLLDRMVWCLRPGYLV